MNTYKLHISPRPQIVPTQPGDVGGEGSSVETRAAMKKGGMVLEWGAQASVPFLAFSF